MGILYTIQPEDKEPIEFTHFDCWEEGETWESIAKAWNTTLGGFLFEVDNSDVIIMQLLRRGYDVYEGDNFVEVYEGEGEEY
jgi:hypothetical protein